MSIKIGLWPLGSERAPRGMRLFEYVNVPKAGRGRMFAVGVVQISRRELERLRDKGHSVDVRVIGWLRLSSGVTPALLDATIGRLEVTGRVHASKELAEAIARHS